MEAHALSVGAPVPSDVGLWGSTGPWGFRDMTGELCQPFLKGVAQPTANLRKLVKLGAAQQFTRNPRPARPGEPLPRGIGRPEPWPRRSGRGCARLPAWQVPRD